MNRIVRVIIPSINGQYIGIDRAVVNRGYSFSDSIARLSVDEDGFTLDHKLDYEGELLCFRQRFGNDLITRERGQRNSYTFDFSKQNLGPVSVDLSISVDLFKLRKITYYFVKADDQEQQEPLLREIYDFIVRNDNSVTRETQNTGIDTKEAQRIIEEGSSAEKIGIIKTMSFDQVLESGEAITERLRLMMIALLTGDTEVQICALDSLLQSCSSRQCATLLQKYYDKRKEEFDKTIIDALMFNIDRLSDMAGFYLQRANFIEHAFASTDIKKISKIPNIVITPEQLEAITLMSCFGEEHGWKEEDYMELRKLKFLLSNRKNASSVLH